MDKSLPEYRPDPLFRSNLYWIEPIFATHLRTFPSFSWGLRVTTALAWTLGSETCMSGMPLSDFFLFITLVTCFFPFLWDSNVFKLLISQSQRRHLGVNFSWNYLWVWFKFEGSFINYVTQGGGRGSWLSITPVHYGVMEGGGGQKCPKWHYVINEQLLTAKFKKFGGIRCIFKFSTCSNNKRAQASVEKINPSWTSE